MVRSKMMNVSILLYIFMLMLAYSSFAGATMVKEVAVGVFSHAPSQIELDRAYLRYHGPEVVRMSGAWLRKYQLWLPYEPPEIAIESFGAVRGRYAELWFGSEEEYLDRPTHGPMTHGTFEPVGEEKQVVVMVPAKPTEEFYDPDPNPEETTIFRWVQIIRYPDGVSVENGEKWFKEVHAKEALQQTGLLKFVSHRVLTELSDQMMELMRQSITTPPPSTEEHAGPKVKVNEAKNWVRVNEYWYKDIDAWRKAVLESPPEYTAPSWGGEYPYVEMVSTFIPYMHDVDFLKGGYIVP